jgi:hypothetical protein
MIAEAESRVLAASVLFAENVFFLPKETIVEKPNWFDSTYAAAFANATAGEALADIANDPKIVQAVTDALADYDANSKKPGWAGPSRTQAIRNALATVLQAAS